MIEDAIYEAIKADADIPPLLAQYGGAAAILTAEIPADCAFPAIYIEQAGGENWGCRAKKGGVATVNVRVFENKKLSRKSLRDIAWKVQRLLDRHALPTLAADGYDNVGCIADPPLFDDDPLTFPGYVVRLRVRFIQS